MRRFAVLLALLCSSTAVYFAPVAAYAAASDVVTEHVAHTQVVQTVVTTNSVLPWGLDRIDQKDLPLSGTYSYATTGAGVKAYIVDSGIKADHVEFSGRVASGWSYRSSSQATLDSWRTTLGSCKNPPAGSSPYVASDHPFDVDVFDYTSTSSDVGSPDNDGHGTHVAGIIGGTTTGVAKGVTLVPVRVLNSCGQGLTSMILAGLSWILENHQLGEPAVVNMSIGFDIRENAIDSAIRSLIAEGIVVIAAAGNSGTSACNTTPAATPGTISVGATSNADAETSWTNYGTCVDMYAPGASITSTWNYQGTNANPYTILSGTSMAAPHVTGAVARNLQGVVTTSTTAADVWSWLDANMTTGKVRRAHLFPPTGESFTPNKLLAIISIDAVTGLTVTSGPRQISAQWVNNSGATYVVTANPGGGTCRTNSSGCTISGLPNNRKYSIAVSAENGSGLVTSSVASLVGPPVSVVNLGVAAQSQILEISWLQVDGEGDGPSITYTATATPGDLKCTSLSTSCTITGLTNGIEYSISVVGVNMYGTSESVTVKSTPDGKPDVPGLATSLSRSEAVALSWSEVTTSANVTYVVKSENGNVVCRTIKTSCVVAGLTNGVKYLFNISTRSVTGLAAEKSLSLSVRPGFTVKKSLVNKGSVSPLSWLVSSLSKGKKSWTESGSCSIVGTKLRAPAVSTSCLVTLKVAKMGKYPAMSTTVRIAVK
jgi:subtilisin family serine protease